MRMASALLGLIKPFSAAMIATLFAGNADAEDFQFDSKEFEKKTFELSGYLEQKEEGLAMRSSSPAYKLAYPGAPPRDELLRNATTLELSGKLNLGDVRADVRGQSSYAWDRLVETTNHGKVMDGGLRWSASPGLSFDIGKRVQRWGKGYAFSPVGFVERPKDATDPQASREGFVMAGGEWTMTFIDKPVSTLGLAAFVVPTNDNLNTDFGRKQDLNPAAKLYFLAYDTDIDLMWLGEGAKPQSFGIDFSRNINSALEIHGEWARTLGVTRNTVNATGVTSSQRVSFNSALLGLRYLTESEITWIGEYYRNGAGYDDRELDDYYSFLERAFAPTAPASLSSKARNVAQSGYARPNPGRDYLYIKASVSEPFNWLYVSTALTTMSNLNDGSLQLTPEISYTGMTNLEIRARLILFSGRAHAEFGEKSSSKRIEVYARYFF